MNKKRVSNLEKIICGTSLILASTLAVIVFLKSCEYASEKVTEFSTYMENVSLGVINET